MAKLNNMISEEVLKAAPFLNIGGLSQDIGRTLVVAPHPDDEALGCGGLMALLRKQHTEVHVVFVTNGGASHPNSEKYNSARLQALRKKEAMRSCQVLGVEENRVHFIGLADSKLDENSQEQRLRFNHHLNEIFEICDFDSLATTFRNDAHNDHRATYAFCAQFVQALGRPIQMIEYPIWLWKNGKAEDWPSYDELEPFRLDISAVADTKQKAIHQHQSQTTRLIDDDPEGFILTEDLLEPFAGDFEYFFFRINPSKSTLNQTYFKRIYSDSQDPWNFRSSAYERKKYLKTLSYLKFYRFEHALEIGCSIGEHSNLLTRHCDNLTAIDISPEAIATAKAKYGHKPIDFKVWNVSEGLPHAAYNLVTVCEVGYYLDKKDLIDLFYEIDNQLKPGGMILLVHWTSYVRDYPLTGKQVHRIFESMDVVQSNYTQKEIYKHKLYELMLWQKQAQGLS